MLILTAGLLLWSLAHLFPALNPPIRKRLIITLGKGGYAGAFSLVIVLAVVLMVYGWRHSEPQFLYQLPVLIVPFAYALILAAFTLFVYASRNSRIKRVIRHPQLTGLILWATAHLLLNGDTRSLLLFGGLAVWAIVEMFALNRRDGAWQKPVAPAWQHDAIGAAIAIGVFALTFATHGYFTGMQLY